MDTGHSLSVESHVCPSVPQSPVIVNYFVSVCVKTLHSDTLYLRHHLELKQHMLLHVMLKQQNTVWKVDVDYEWM